MRSLSAAHPNKIHIIAIDYRGFGLSSGTPSEEGLITDGMTVIRFAMEQLGIPPSRIAVAGQSLGTAVTFGAAETFAAQDPPIEFSAVITIAAFSDLKRLILTYRIGGWFPILSPLRGYPMIQQYFVKYLLEPWDATTRVASLVRRSPNLNLVLMHAENDWEIPWKHCDALFAAAVNATSEIPLTLEDALNGKVVKTYGDESTLATWPEEKSKGRRINQWVVKWGGHNEVVTSAGTSVIVAKALGL
jgi:abhydrolase domain-containing protein 12